jgi:mercuric ion binding protein
MRIIGLVAAAVALAVTVVVVRSGPAADDQRPGVNPQAVAANWQTVTLSVPKMDCPGCEIGVRIAASKVDGVKEVKTDSDTRTADVTYDPAKATAQAIANAIKAGTGFDTNLPPAATSKT